MKLKYIIALAASAAVFTSCEKAEEATGEAAAAVEAAAEEAAAVEEAAAADDRRADQHR